MHRARKPPVREAAIDWFNRQAAARRKVVTSVAGLPSPASTASKPDMSIVSPIAWTEDDDRLLIETLVKVGKVPWKNVAMCMRGRAASQCRDRFHKHIKKAAKYRNLIPQHVLDYRRHLSAIPATDDELDAKAVEEAFSDALAEDLFSIELPEDLCAGSGDKFSFEEIYELGAMPHLAQPVPLTVLSPRSLEALPKCQASPVLKPKGPGTVTFSMVPSGQLNWSRRGGMCATAGPIGARDGFTESTFAKINRLVNKPTRVPPKKRRSVAKPRARRASVIVFNPQMVRACTS